LRGGKIGDIVFNLQDLSLTMIMEHKNKELILLQILRLLMESMTGYNVDEPFLVFINDCKIFEFDEKTYDFDHRIFTI